MKMRKPRSVARQLGKTEGALAQMRYLGIGPPYVKIGRHVMYRDVDVNEWIERKLIRTEGD